MFPFPSLPAQVANTLVTAVETLDSTLSMTGMWASPASPDSIGSKTQYGLCRAGISLMLVANALFAGRFFMPLKNPTISGRVSLEHLLNGFHLQDGSYSSRWVSAFHLTHPLSGPLPSLSLRLGKSLPPFFT